MRMVCRPSRLSGSVDIPGSKSHTIRAVSIAALADGTSRIEAPLISADALAAVDAYRALGAEIEMGDDAWTIRGTGGVPVAGSGDIDVRNSGTTLRIAVGSAALLREGEVTFTGDDQIRKRPIGPLIDAIRNLGASAKSLHDNGCAPLTVGGTLGGGRTSIEAVTSQYLSSLLINCPLAEGDTEIDVTVLNERPYVYITLDWLQRGGITLERDELTHFRIPGGQRYPAMDIRVPADFSSATFFLAAGALGDNDVLVRGLDMNDTQGDKAVVDYLRQMGARVEDVSEGIRVRGGDLRGCELDLNATPDALPMMAVVGCFARGETRLVNVPQARFKETDRIAVMTAELSKLGADIEELADGLVIRESRLRPGNVSGHHDHRVVMALAVAGTLIQGETQIDTAEAVEVTFPTFVQRMMDLGGDLRNEEDA